MLHKYQLDGHSNGVLNPTGETRAIGTAMDRLPPKGFREGLSIVLDSAPVILHSAVFLSTHRTDWMIRSSNSICMISMESAWSQPGISF